MRQFVAKNVIFLIFVNIVIKPFWVFGIDTQVQNAVGNEAYGAYFAFFNLCLIFQIIMDVGLQSYATNTISKSPHTFTTLFPNILVGKLFLTILYLLIIVLVGWAMQYTKSEMSLLLMVSCIHIVGSFLLFLRSNISAFQQFTLDSFFSIFDRMLLIIVCSAFLYIPIFKPFLDIQLFITIQIACVFIACLVALYCCSKLLPIKWEKIRIHKIWIIAKQSLPYAFLIFAMAIFIRVDTIILQYFLGNHSVGLYGAAFRLLDVINNSSGVLIASILLPFFGRNLLSKIHIEDIVRLFTNILLPFSCLIAIIGWFWQMPIMEFLYKDNDPQVSYVTLGCLLFAYPFYCLNYIYSTLLTANANIKFLIKIALIGIIINVTLNVIFIQKIDIVAAAIASVITIATVALCCIWKAQKVFNFSIWNLTFFLQLVTYIICIVLVGILLKQLNIHFISQIIITIIFGVLCLFVFRFIKWKDLLTLKK